MKRSSTVPRAHSAEAILRMDYRVTATDRYTGAFIEVIEDTFLITTEIVYTDAERQRLADDFLAFAAHELAGVVESLERKHSGAHAEVDITSPVVYDYEPVN